MSRCDECRFSEMTDEEFMCQRYPPIVIQREDCSESTFPVILPDGWCGEFQAKEASFRRRKRETNETERIYAH